jgi:hypothetical protein
MTNERNRSVPVQVGNISAAVAEILDQEGIVSDNLATNFSILESNQQFSSRRSLAQGTNPIGNFEDILGRSQELQVFDSFIQRAWGTSQGTFGAGELWESYREALESYVVNSPSVFADASGAGGALDPKRKAINFATQNTRRQERVGEVDFVDFYLGKSDAKSESNLKTALSYETTGDNVVDNLNYLVFKSNVFDPGGHNADAFSVWLRGIPSTDLARAYPFLRLSILQSKSSANREDRKAFVPTMSWDFALKGDSYVSEPTAWVVDEESAPLFRRAVRGARSGTTETTQEQFVYKALPDVLTAPQTFRARGEVLNPMVPQLGLLNFSTRTDATGYGLIANRSASMSLKLFDRSRLSDIAPLVSPTFRGSVAFEIEWGWKCDIAEHMHTPYTRFIDQLRTKEYYSLTSPNFSFADDGSVNIELRLHLRPNDLIEKLDISVGALAANATGAEDAETIRGLEENLRSLATELTNLISSLTPASNEDLAVNTSPVTFLGRFSNAEAILNIQDGDPIIQEIKDFIDAYSNDTPGGSSTSAQTGPRENNTSLNRIVELLRSIFGAYTPDERAERFRSRSAGSGGERSSSAAPNLSESGRGSLTVGNAEAVVARVPKQFNPSTFGQIVIDAARAEVGVSAPRDTKRSPRVDQYNRFGALGGNWCGAFVSWVLDLVAGHMGGRTIKSSGATRMFIAARTYENITTFTPQDVTSGRYQIKPGDVFVMISPGRDSQENSNRTLDWHRTNIQALREGTGTPVLGHVGFCVGGYNRATNRFPTIEGNTSSDGLRDGGRVHERTRVLDPNIIVGFFRINALGTERRNTSRTRNSEGQTPSGPNVPSPQVNVSEELRRRIRSVGEDSALGVLRNAISEAVRKRIDRLYAVENVPENIRPFIRNTSIVETETVVRRSERRVYNNDSLDSAFAFFVVAYEMWRQENFTGLDSLFPYASSLLQEGVSELKEALKSFEKNSLSGTRENKLSVANGRLPESLQRNFNDQIFREFSRLFDPQSPIVGFGREDGTAANNVGIDDDGRDLPNTSGRSVPNLALQKARKLLELLNFSKNVARVGSRIRGNSGVGSGVQAISEQSSSENLPTFLTNWQKSLDPWMFNFIDLHTNPREGESINPFAQENLGGKPFWEGGGDRLWTSLGRIIGFFAGIPLATKAASEEEIFNEVQFFWHSFNSNASWYANQPICNFLIEKGELQTVLSGLFARQGLNIPLATLLNAINQEIIRNPASASYGFDRFYEPNNGSGPRKKKEEFEQNNNVFVREQNALLSRSYARFGANVSPVWSVPNLALLSEVRNRLNDNGETSVNNDKIVRVVLRDNAANRWSGLARVLQSARFTDPRLPTQTDLNLTTWNDTEARELINAITNGQNQGIDIERDPTTGLFRVRGGFKRLKELYRKVMPTIVYGGEGTTVTSASFSSMDNAALASIQIMRNISGSGLSPNQSKASGLPLRVSPSRIKVDMLGFPYLGYSQYFFADFNTGTTVDNIYMATNISSEISPGKFITTFEGIAPEDAYSRFESPLLALTRAASIIRERDESPPTGGVVSNVVGALVGSNEGES